MQVFKFGGASIRDAAAIRNVAKILEAHRGHPLLIVVSAMGKTTNALEKIVDAYVSGEGDPFALLEQARQAHFQVMVDLFDTSHEVFAAVNDTFVEIEWVIEDELQDSYDYIYDQIVSIGEMVSTKIVAAYLRQQNLPTHWLDVRDAILTDNTYRDGQVDWEATRHNIERNVKPLLGEAQFVLTQGFLGGTSENFTTTLGREGSDYSAAIFSYCLDARDMTIWKDVPGILTADPKLFDTAQLIEQLSYKEAIEMTYYGAKVIHPKTIKPLQNKQIPLYVRSFVAPEGKGSVICAAAGLSYPPMIIRADDQCLIHIATRDFSFVAEHHLGRLFTLFASHRIRINMMQNTAISFAVCVNNRKERIAALCKELETDFNVQLQESLSLLTVRHYEENLLKDLVGDAEVVLEERIRDTVKMVIATQPG
ncbi:MAG: aspartate kinase [Bacteroidota bacterium]